MNIDKQVKEIRAISQVIQKTGLGEHLSDAIAVGVFDAGYHKASEVAREIFEEIDDNFIIISLHNKYETFPELKKKYTEGEG